MADTRRVSGVQGEVLFETVHTPHVFTLVGEVLYQTEHHAAVSGFLLEVLYAPGIAAPGGPGGSGGGRSSMMLGLPSIGLN